MSLTAEISFDAQIEQCRNGNMQAYNAVYTRYAKAMYNSSMRVLNNVADAEDMVQEAFIDAFKNLDRFTYKSTFEAWLRRIVINKSISLLRRKKVKWIDADNIPLEAPNEPEVDEADFIYDINRIKKAISRLPENYRLIFNLYTIDELKQEEIAAMLKISHNNVRTIYHRARKKILEMLNAEQENILYKNY